MFSHQQTLLSPIIGSEFLTTITTSQTSDHTSSDDNDHNNPTYIFHSWFCLIVFIIDIIFIIASPSIPIFPTLSTIKTWYRYVKREPSSNNNNTNIQQEEEVEESTTNRTIANSSGPTHSFTSLLSQSKFYHVDLDLSLASIIAFIVLLISGTLDWDNMKIGLIGAPGQHLQPYSILLLFMSLSYVCVSLDITGLFSFIANWIIKKSNYNGHKLFIWFSLFASVLTIFTSNDIVILTLTPICCYMCSCSKNLDPTPYVISQFFLANVWSVILEIGNPTNVIVALAYDLNFLVYSKWMAIPATASGIVCFVLLYVYFFSSIPTKIEVESQNSEPAGKETVPEENTTSIEEENPTIDQVVAQQLSNEDKSSLIGQGEEKKNDLDIKAAIIKSIALLLCLVTLSVTSLIKFGESGDTIPPWIVTCSFFGFSLIYDVIMDTIQFIKKRRGTVKVFESSIWKVLKRLPWKIIPFILSMFTIVQLLNYYGWTDLLAKRAAELIVSLSGANNPLDQKPTVRSLAVTTLVMSYLSAISCNIINNQPMTILFTSVISSKEYKILSPLQRKGSMFSLILGSNFGANITLFGALAGIMFLSILRQNGITSKQINYFTFLKFGLIITPLVILVGAFFIFIELLLFEE
ncbi:predicted protein [Naegleria gruberi]|uniref:Predicted protein n=1 Tax=Naegleria gruberi TaxID=5762 RepID=D2VKH7_NAEGR|nr:uncharacterized protein NAEGRDRAFT_69397 [Naegleria gruberi]EFC42691.1 predicted protein [Naegleria gruberi]|eukprot:XP_002675435.1 predicted protein [Naegleria gruberi strain NEG-M]